MKEADLVKVLEHIRLKLQMHTAATNTGELKAYLIGFIDGQLGDVTIPGGKK